MTQSCDHQCTAGCKDPRDITEYCHTEGEVFENPCSCDMFYSCTNGIKELVKCEDGLQYNSAIRSVIDRAAANVQNYLSEILNAVHLQVESQNNNVQ